MKEQYAKKGRPPTVAKRTKKSQTQNKRTSPDTVSYPVDFGSSQISMNYRGMILRIAMHYSNPDDEGFPDLCQAGYLGLMRSRRTWRSNKGCCRSSWYYIHIRNAIQKQKAQLTSIASACYITTVRHHVTTVQLDPDERSSIPDTDPDPAEQCCLNEEAISNARLQAEMWRRLNKHLTTLEREIVIDHFVDLIPIRQLDRKYHRPTYPIIRDAKHKMQAAIISWRMENKETDRLNCRPPDDTAPGVKSPFAKQQDQGGHFLRRTA